MDIPPIYGFNECSEMGNDIFAPSVFVGGCNLRCPYCMNSKLIQPKDAPQVDVNTIIDYILKNNREWVVISGGEPTCMRLQLLVNLCNMFKGFGCKVGLSTNGTNADDFNAILPYVNYVALDIKSNKNNVYYDIAQIDWSSSPFIDVIRSQSMLRDTKRDRDDFDYEIRTTLYPKYIDKKAIKGIGSILRSDEKWVLQQFRHAKGMYAKEAYDVEPYSEDKLKELLKIAQKFSSEVQLRYV